MRKRIVLSAIISMHTLDGEPVGSKTLLGGNIPLGVSSATLRNEMAQLTEIGLLEQPHVSAGRVPTAMGYQYYVHKLLRRNAVSEAERAQIKQQVDGFDTDPDRACEEAARLLGRVTGLAGIATTPEGNNLSVAHFRLIRVGRYNIAVIAVTSSGGVRTRICRTARELTDEELTRVQAMLNICCACCSVCCCNTASWICRRHSASLPMSARSASWSARPTIPSRPLWPMRPALSIPIRSAF